MGRLDVKLLILVLIPLRARAVCDLCVCVRMVGVVESGEGAAVLE